MYKHLLAALALGAALVVPSAQGWTQAQRYPAKTIELVVSYGAGGSTDLIARAIAQKLQDRLGQSVVVINKPGASGTIGATQVAHASPDGHTLYAGFTTEMAVVPQLSRSVKYSLDDFEPIAVTGIVPVVLIASKNVKANSISGLIEELRSAPGKYTYGGSIGSPSHIMGAWLNRIRGLNVTHIPYRGGAQAVGDVSGGHIDLFFGGVSAAKGAIDAGLVKAIGLVGDARSSALPDVPTFKEMGLTDFDLDSWTVLLGPKGLPAEIVELLRRETALALADPLLRASLGAQGVEPSSSKDARAFLERERDKFGRVVRELGIMMD
jgi:tripartite-type tricarboxylate transporter receptor subunit TctC